jgi:hypothetical protein
LTWAGCSEAAAAILLSTRATVSAPVTGASAHDSAPVGQQDDVRREDVEQVPQVACFDRLLERRERGPGLGRGNNPLWPRRAHQAIVRMS